MFTEQWEIVMSDIGDESEKQISYRTTRFCVDKMNEGKAGHAVQIFVYPWNYITIHVLISLQVNGKVFPLSDSESESGNDSSIQSQVG